MTKKNLSKILYVEDEPDIAAIAQIALADIGGFVVKSCYTGQEAVNVATAFQPDLLLLDVMMPGMDGPTTLAALRKLPSLTNTPAIFMTAKIQPNEVAEYLTLGALDVVAKPFDPMMLAKQLQVCWEKYQEKQD